MMASSLLPQRRAAFNSQRRRFADRQRSGGVGGEQDQALVLQLLPVPLVRQLVEHDDVGRRNGGLPRASRFIVHCVRPQRRHLADNRVVIQNTVLSVADVQKCRIHR